MLGRDFYAGEDLAGAPKTVMLTYAAWQTWFGGKPDVVGRAVTLNGISYTVIGVSRGTFNSLHEATRIYGRRSRVPIPATSGGAAIVLRD